MSKIFFISDLHFNHNNIIKYCNRPYETVNEMNEDLIRRWNSVVGNDDTVWFLGDLGFGRKEDVRSLVQRLNGHKKMIMGNHDRWKPKTYYEMGFEFVSPYPIIVKGFFVLSHAPIFTNTNSPFYNIYGHVHNEEIYQTETEHSRCVCVERQDYTPITIPLFDGYVPELDD